MAVSTYSTEQEPTLETIASQVCTSKQFSEPIYYRLCKEIAQDKLFHRKQWEYIFILRALEQLCVLQSSFSGLGFGCGKEPLAAVMAKRSVDVICTDIEPVEKGDAYWGSTNVRDYFYEGICTWEQFEKHVSFRPANMNDIPDDLGIHEFHLVILCSRTSWFASTWNRFRAQCQQMPEGRWRSSAHDRAQRRGRGGNVRERRSLLISEERHPPHAGAGRQQGNVFLPINFNMGSDELDKYVDLPPFNRNKHLKLLVEEKYVTTSIGFVILKR